MKYGGNSDLDSANCKTQSDTKFDWIRFGFFLLLLSVSIENFYKNEQ